MTRIRPHRALWVAAAISVCASGPAVLTQPPATRPSEASQERIKVGVDLVTTPLTIRGRNGQFLPDIKPAEIEIFEDGVRQTMVTFSLSHGGRLFNVGQPPPSTNASGFILPPLRPAKDTSGRVFLIFIDDLHLRFDLTPRVRDLYERITTQLIHDGDLVSVVSTGPSSIAIDLTYDRKRLDAAKNKITGSGLRARDVIDVPSGADGPPEVRYRANVAFRTAYDVVEQFEALHDRRKSVIYLSSGYDLNPFPEDRAKQEAERSGAADSNPFGQQKTTFSEADIVSQMSELTRAAVRSNVVVYTIDPRGLVAGPDISDPVDMAAYQRHVSKTQDTLRVIAEQTGGRAIVNQNDFNAALQLIDAETSDYYIVGYYSTNTDQSKRRRKIEIRVARAGADVTHRTEYTLHPIRH